MFHVGSYVSEEDTECLSYYSAALRLVNQKLKDPTQHKSDALIGAVSAFMCHEVGDLYYYGTGY
jgi:hypothetical protein